MARRSDRWDAHPVLAWWVRVAVLLVPLAVSVVTALLVIAALPDPHGATERLGWWCAVLASSYAAAVLVDRLARRALPLAVLLRLSLVFPDRAPSRLAAARRTSLREIERQLRRADEPAEAARTLVSLVGALGLHDKRTRGHSERVRAYVDVLTEELGLPEHDRARLRWAALLHDIGKLSVPGPVLNGGRDLADEEWAALRAHPDEGERLAAAMMPWLGEWGRCVREHHERWDGSGYPQGLRGEQISLGARIVAVADAFEVMTAHRSYQQAIKAPAAREELARCAGTDFDPAVVRAFLQVSIGRLRGVLGPLSFLPALPLAALADRAGRAAQGITTVAAVSAVALATTAGGSASPTPLAAVPDTPVATPAAAPTRPVLTPSATPRAHPSLPTVSRPPAARPQATVVRPAPAPVVAATRAAASAPVSAVLYATADGRLVGAPPGSGSVLVPTGGSVSFGLAVAGRTIVHGSVAVVLFHQLQTRHGNGQPTALVQVSLADCGPQTCRTLASSSTPLARGRTGYVEQRVTIGTVDAGVPAGDVLRVTVSLAAHGNVTGLVLGVGGSAASRVVRG